MSLPGALTLTTLSGTYTAPDGTPLGGQLTFTPSSALTNESGHPVLAATPLTVRLAPGTGSFSISLLNTDNALLPDTWMWHVIVAVPGAQESYFFGLPSTLGPATDINTLTPVSPPPSGASFVSSINGQTGDVILADGFGILPPAGDLGGGTTLAPQVTATHLAAPLPIAQGGTGAASGSAALTALGGISAASPAFTGTPTAPTATALTHSTQIATTAYADSAVGVEASRAGTAEGLKLAKASNLSDLASASTARTNLGLGTAAVLASSAVAQTANNLSDLANAATARGNLGAQGVRTPTAVKTGTSYTASAGDFARIDSTAGAYTVTLPAAPADKTVIGVKLVASATPVNAVTITRGGSDTFNVSGGTTLTLKLLNQGVLLQYDTAATAWDVHSDDLPLGALDTRYAAGQAQFPVLSYGADATGAADSTAAIAAAQAAAVAAGGGYVTFGPGTFKMGLVTIAAPAVNLTSQYAVPPLVHFRFAGPGATILTPLASNQRLFAIQAGKEAAGVRFEGGFTVKAHASGSTGPAIDLNGARQWIIESPSYLDSLEGGSGTPGTYAQVIGLGVNTYACRVVNPVCEGQAIGASFVGCQNRTTVVANSNLIENPLFEGNTSTYMIDAAGTVHLAVRGGIIEGNTVTAAIRLGQATELSSVWLEGNGTTFAMDAAGVDNPTFNYDPGGCLLKFCNFVDTSSLTIPSGVTPGTMVIGSLGNQGITDNTHSLLLNFQAAFTATLLNNASGGTNGTTVTTGNSGGSSGTAFAAVTGPVTFSSTQAYAPSALSYELAGAGAATGMQSSLPATFLAGETLYTRAYVYYSGSAVNGYVSATGGLHYKAGCDGTHFYAVATPGSAAVGTHAVTPGVWYRVESQFSFSAGSATVQVYDAAGNFIESLASTGGNATSASGIAYWGTPTGGTITGTMFLANLGVSTGTWLGPSIPGVTSVTAADASVVVAGTQVSPTVATGTLDVIAGQHPPAAAWSNNSFKITGLANGSASTDAAAFGQIPAAADIQWFTSSGTWTKPAGAVAVDVILCPGAGGGGSGRRGASGSVCTGGGGGGGGGTLSRSFAASDLTSTVTVTVGTGGNGGAAVTADSTNGNAGSSGAPTTFGGFCEAIAAAGGPAGTATTVGAGTGSIGTGTGGNGGGSPSGGGAGGSAGIAVGGGGGGGGGGISVTPAAFNGGNGNFSIQGIVSGSPWGAAGVVGGASPGTGTAPTAQGTPAAGPGGGAASITGAAQAGANGNTGAGGGGGGASLNGSNSGAGGNGGGGFALVITHFC